VSVERRATGDAARDPSGETLAIVFSGPGPRGGWPPAIAAIRQGSGLPVFAVVPANASGRAIRRLYEAGAAGVFASARVDARLALYLAEVLSLRLARGPARGPDTALARTVRAHLKLLPHETPAVEARRGLIRVWGTVDSLPARQDVEACIAAVPGVRGLDASALHVLPAPATDAEIRRAARRLLRASPGIDERTLSFSVDRGHVVLSGTVASRQQARRLSDLASQLRGVRSVELRVEASAPRAASDRQIAARLQGIVRDLFPASDIGLRFFGGAAVLTGRVANLRTKRAVEAFVAEDDAVERIVNLLDVGT
jgi:osmotically-inducible protein OsmY